MNENLYTKERIEDIYQERISNEIDATITYLLEKNLTLHEEVRNFKREQKIQSIRLCEVMEQKENYKEEIEERGNEINQLFLHQIDLIGQLNDENQVIINLRKKMKY